jgi:hypothetical protein
MPRGLKNRAHQSVEDPAPAFARLRVEYWPIERLKPYERNPRKNDALTYDERERVSGSSSRTRTDAGSVNSDAMQKRR